MAKKVAELSTIKVRPATKSQLDKLGTVADTYDSVISRLIVAHSGVGGQ